MKIGLSTYSLVKALMEKKMTVLDVIQWIKDNGGEHVEIVPIGYSLDNNDELVDAIRNKAAEVGIDISNYAISGNLYQKDEEGFENEIKRLMGQVDIANRLGTKLMRFDVCFLRPDDPENTIDNFEKQLPRFAEGCRRVADYAAKYGITVTVENHGYFVNGSDRVQRLINMVNRPNYKHTLDVGNFMCVDECSIPAVKKNLPYTVMIHLKDFYKRSSYRYPGSQGWFPTKSGDYLRGAIIGNGDIDMWEIIRLIKNSGYDGYISIEFEGMEDCFTGSKMGMDNAKRIWNEV